MPVNRRWPLHTICFPVLLLLVLFCSACSISKYSPKPSSNPAAESEKKAEFLSFSYLSRYSGHEEEDRRRVTMAGESQIIMELFSAQLGYLKVAATPRPPDLGPHVNVYQTDGPPPSLWCRIHSWTLGILPCYADGIVYETHFDLYVDNTLKKGYRYEISRKGMGWIGLVPFFWINFLLTEYTDAFSATVYQFMSDVKQDRLL